MKKEKLEELKEQYVDKYYYQVDEKYKNIMYTHVKDIYERNASDVRDRIVVQCDCLTINNNSLDDISRNIAVDFDCNFSYMYFEWILRVSTMVTKEQFEAVQGKLENNLDSMWEEVKSMATTNGVPTQS